MPNPGLDFPTTKITLNIFTKDYEDIKRWYGAGWTGRLRDLLHDHCQQTKADRRNMMIGKRHEATNVK